MKKIIFLLFLILIGALAFTGDSPDYFLLNEINFAREIRVQKTEDGREVSLNSKQRKDFLDAIKVSKKISLHKGFCPYRVYIDYSKANDISFMSGYRKSVNTI